ncbi:MAG: factor-independent urate hydroxylase [Gemmatimonadota bacterium]
MARLGGNRYGKAGIRLVKVARGAREHTLRDVTAAVALEGDFADAHLTGDNARILPTDTMKNTVVALARDHYHETSEAFALQLTEHFMRAAPIEGARVTLREHLWSRLNDHAFARAGTHVRTTRVRRTRAGAQVRAGVRGLYLLKTSHSEFTGYIKDRYTTLPETRDRILATVLNAEWTYDPAELDYDDVWHTAFAAIRETFAAHHSLSVQHTLYALGEAVIARCPPVARIRFALPNKHHLLVDLSKFGLENRNEIFLATSEPFGLIEAEVTRA